MKNLLNEKSNKELLRRKWERLSFLWGSEQNGATIEEENKLIIEIEKSLNFKNEEERTQWGDLCSSFKCWEDFEEMTLKIINREDNQINGDLLESYEQVALDVCKDSNFFLLFDTFAAFSGGWVARMDKWQKHLEELKNDPEDYKNFLQEFKEVYEKDFSEVDIWKYHFYGFEDCPFCMFYTYSQESKGELIDCIFDRYIGGLSQEEEIYFLQSLIKGLL